MSPRRRPSAYEILAGQAAPDAAELADHFTPRPSPEAPTSLPTGSYTPTENRTPEQEAGATALRYLGAPDPEAISVIPSPSGAEVRTVGGLRDESWEAAVDELRQTAQKLEKELDDPVAKSTILRFVDIISHVDGNVALVYKTRLAHEVDALSEPPGKTSQTALKNQRRKRIRALEKKQPRIQTEVLDRLYESKDRAQALYALGAYAGLHERDDFFVIPFRYPDRTVGHHLYVTETGFGSLEELAQAAKYNVSPITAALDINHQPPAQPGELDPAQYPTLMLINGLTNHVRFDPKGPRGGFVIGSVYNQILNGKRIWEVEVRHLSDEMMGVVNTSLTNNLLQRFGDVHPVYVSPLSLTALDIPALRTVRAVNTARALQGVRQEYAGRAQEYDALTVGADALLADFTQTSGALGRLVLGQAENQSQPAPDQAGLPAPQTRDPQDNPPNQPGTPHA